MTNSPKRLTRRWLQTALLLLSMTLMPTIATANPLPPSDAQSMISTTACATECDRSLKEALANCPTSSGSDSSDRLSPSTLPQFTSTSPTSTPTSSSSTGSCESACKSELHNLEHELDDQCDASVKAAVADERRHYEPELAKLTTERDDWRESAERAIGAQALWRHVGFAGAGCAAASVTTAAIFEYPEAHTIAIGCAIGAVAGFVASL